jgi:beta-glucosidase/6-phospho-beta-glucosidase/beta-galactosidase
MNTVMFATGIECSYPKVDGGKRRDQLAETRHYENWRLDLELCRELGVKVLRYGPPYYRMHTGPQSYDWSFTDEVLPPMRDMGLTPILDLCHFGVPDWAGDFQNTDWPPLFAGFAQAFAERYPWVRLYTPVNEILVCSRFSCKEGIWNEQQKSDAAMVRAHANQCKATLMAMEAIVKLRPEAVFFQSETCEVFSEVYPETQRQVDFYNSLRFITFDFLYGRPPEADVLLFLLDHGLKTDEYHWLSEHGRAAAPHCVMGLDYYEQSEKRLAQDGSFASAGPTLGWHSVASQYWRRYRRPMMLTETNYGTAEGASDWLWKTWLCVENLRREGAPVLGFTWYSLQDQVDWDIKLREVRGHVVPNGLYDLDRNPHPAARAFKQLTQRYSHLPLVSAFAMGEIVGTEGTTEEVELRSALI